jgi:transcriptional regulator with XRE-family HTH domain
MKPRSRARAADRDVAAELIETSPGLGERLRLERERTGLSLRELARRLEVSPSLISQIETGKIRPSVRTLYAMLDEYDLSVEQLFAQAPRAEASPAEARKATWTAVPGRRRRAAEDRVQRAHDRRVIELESGVRWERLTATSEDDVDFHATVYEVGGASSPEGQLVRHHGREFGLVLSGRLGITVGTEQFVLEEGDSISFDSSIPHRLYNDGDEQLNAIWFVLGR